MNPETRTFHPEPEDQHPRLPPDWPRLGVGDAFKARGWWWRIVAVHGERLEIEPVKKARPTGKGKGKRRKGRGA